MVKNFIETISNFSNTAIKEIEDFVNDLEKVPFGKEDNSIDSRAAEELEERIESLLHNVHLSFNDFIKEKSVLGKDYYDNIEQEMMNIVNKFKTNIKEYDLEKISTNFISFMKSSYNEMVENIEKTYKDMKIDDLEQSNSKNTKD
ncbi:MAG: hypothetical protein ACK4OM_00060 [Alphaproteobacteria bacterium]